MLTKKEHKECGPFAHDSSVAPSSSPCGHTAMLRSAQIVPFGNDFLCPRPLTEFDIAILWVRKAF